MTEDWKHALNERRRVLRDEVAERLSEIGRIDAELARDAFRRQREAENPFLRYAKRGKPIENPPHPCIKDE